MALQAIVDGIDISAARLFLATIDLGSVSKAAARLRISQPSATAKLHKLERQLGTTLLERTATGSALTPDGARLAPACAALVASATALVERADDDGGQRTALRLASTRHVADHFLPRWVTDGALDDVRVDLLELDTRSVAQAVRAGDAMIGFAEGPRAPIGLRSAPVASERVVAVVGRRHEWYGRRDPVPVQQLVAATLVLVQSGSGTRDVVVDALAQHEVGGGDHLDVSTASAARLAAIEGTGVAFLPACWADAHVERGDLSALDTGRLVIDQPVRAVWRGARPASDAARRLVAHLTATR